MSQTITRRALLAGAGAISTSCATKRELGFSGFAFVANEEGQAIAAVDLKAFAVVRHIRLDSSPSQLVNHPKRKSVYALTPSNATVHEISAAKLQRERSLSLGVKCHDLRLSPELIPPDAGIGYGNTLWAVSKEARQLVEVKLDSFEVGRRISIPGEPTDFDLSRERPLALISLGASGTAALLNLENGKSEIVECGSPIGMARFRLDGRQWITGHQEKRLLSIFDTLSGKVVVRLPLAMRPDHFCFKSDGGQLFVTGEGLDGVAVVFPYSTEVSETVLAGRSPGEMCVSPMLQDSPEFLFVTNPQSGHVTIINIETRKVLAVTQVGSEPMHVTVTPDNQYALVLNQRSGDMAVITFQLSARRTKSPAALFTMIPVGSKPVSAVVQRI